MPSLIVALAALLLTFAASCLAAPVVAAGFRVEQLYQVPRESAGSWVAMTVDPRGRLIVSDQYGALHRVTPPPTDQTEPVRAERLALPLGSAQGLAFVGDSLYATVAEKVHGGPGLFRARDTNGDGELDEVALLRPLDGTGEHGPHAIVPAPDGRSLYILAGNATRLPPLARAAARETWHDAALFPRVPALLGSETRGIPPGGWICRTDLDGREWTLVSAGYRNHYDAAFNADGELFTVDSDTEFDVNLPWYRPTRVLHVVSGSDFGWRPGAAKLPEDSAETLPSVLPLGLGSPTGVTFGYGARFPTRYVNALFVADWSYGRLLAVHLRPSGSSYRGQSEEIVRGAPLPITDIVVSRVDGALYFLTGGRRMQSALWRLTWIGADAPGEAARVGSELRGEREQRHALEQYHGRIDAAAIAAAWPRLASADPFLRAAAIRALESQPVEGWRDRALTETDARRGLAALLALARTEAKLSVVLQAVARWPLASLSPDLQLEKVRLVSRCVAPLTLTANERRAILEDSDRAFPAPDHSLNLALGELLAFLDAPRIVERTLATLHAAPTREEQMAHATTLRMVRTGWTTETRTQYFRWLQLAATFRGGSAFKPTLNRIKTDALASLTPDERVTLEPILRGEPSEPASTPAAIHSGQRSSPTPWTVAELTPQIEQALRRPRDPARGRTLFGATGCFACHAVGGEGGALGPDLSGAGARFGVRDLLEAILEPSKAISDQYGTVVVTLVDGTQHHGRLVNQTEQQVHVSTNLLDPTDVLRLDRTRVRGIEPSPVSLMPSGLLDRLPADDIADLIAFLLAGTARDRL